MCRKISVFILLCLVNSLALAEWIDADSFALGTDVSNVIPGVTLGWEEHAANAPATQLFHSIIGAANGPRHYFGGPTSPVTAFLDYYSVHSIHPDYLLQDAGEFRDLTATFDVPVTSFGVSAESLSSDTVHIFAFDPNGNFIGAQPLLWDTNSLPGCNQETGVPCFGGTQMFYFNTNVGSVKIASWSAPAGISGIFVPNPVPLPGSFGLFVSGILGLAGIVRKRSQL